MAQMKNICKADLQTAENRGDAPSFLSEIVKIINVNNLLTLSFTYLQVQKDVI